MTLPRYTFSRQHRAHFSEDVYAFVPWRYVAIKIWRIKELFVSGIVASTIKVNLGAAIVWWLSSWLAEQEVPG